MHPGWSGARQMALDEALLDNLKPDSAPVLRFYTWERPTLSLGYFQNYKKVVCEPFVRHNNIDVVRRPTGGRAVLHDREVTYAVIAYLKGAFENQTLQETYELIAEALNLGLQRLGISRPSISLDSSLARSEPGLPQCFVSVSKYELARDTKKIIGSAQKRSRDRFLQHGSILLDFDSRLQNGCIQKPDPQIETRIAPLNRILGRSLQFAEVAGHFCSAFETAFRMKLESSDLTPEEASCAERLERKYGSEEWTAQRCK